MPRKSEKAEFTGVQVRKTTLYHLRNVRYIATQEYPCYESLVGEALQFYITHWENVIEGAPRTSQPKP